MNKKKTVNLDLKQYGMMIALVAIFLIFAVLTKGANMSPMNINNLIMQNGYVVILAVGMLLCCLTGNVDLGVGSLVALTGAVCGIVMIDLGLNMWVAILLALLTGLASGAFVGFFVAYLGIPPFITTLATWLMWRGLTYTVLQAQTKGPFKEDFTFIAYLNLDPDKTKAIVKSVESEAKKLEDMGRPPIVITSPIVRIYFKRLTEDYYKDLIVISYNEIESSVELQSVGMVTA